MAIDLKRIDWSALQTMWDRASEGVRDVRRRADPTGMTRPARDPEEAAFLRATGREGPFVEVEMPGWREWVARRDRPARFYAPPSEAREDVRDREESGG